MRTKDFKVAVQPAGLLKEPSEKINLQSIWSAIHLSKWNAAISPLCLSKPAYGVPSTMKSLGYLGRRIWIKLFWDLFQECLQQWKSLFHTVKVQDMHVVKSKDLNYYAIN